MSPFLCFTEEYSQEIPVNKPWEKVPGPPILPPHLLQVILNKDTPLSVSIFFFFFFPSMTPKRRSLDTGGCSVRQNRIATESLSAAANLQD